MPFILITGVGLMRTGPLVGLAALAVCGALACGGGGGGGGSSTPTSPSTPSTPATPSTPSTPASPTAVVVGNNSFSPAAMTVAPGTTVRWTWDTCSSPDPYGGTGAPTCTDHSIVWDVSATGSPTQSQGSYQRTFDTAGTYNYHCAIHGAAMSGKVVVQ
jgi:plastocyanin